MVLCLNDDDDDDDDDDDNSIIIIIIIIIIYPYNITHCVHTNSSQSYFDSLILRGTEIYGK